MITVNAGCVLVEEVDDVLRNESANLEMWTKLGGASAKSLNLSQSVLGLQHRHSHVILHALDMRSPEQ